MDSLKIVHVGPLIGTTKHRAMALTGLGHDLISVNDRFVPMSALSRRYSQVRKKLGFPVDALGVNRQLLDFTTSVDPDLYLLEKALYLRPKTVLNLKRAGSIVVNFTLDDMENPGNQSRQYLASIRHFDAIVTNKPHNLEFFKSQGAKDVILLGNAFSESVHRPIQITEQEKKDFGCDVSFVGGFETERAQQLLQLAKRGIRIRVWGNNWHKFKHEHKNLVLERRPVFDDDYARVVAGSKILLGFLRKVNRDQETTRSFEIPACGGFLLAERSPAHSEMFQEGKQAELFSEVDELESKIRTYLANDQLRRTIAENGMLRVWELQASQTQRMKLMLKQIGLVS